MTLVGTEVSTQEERVADATLRCVGRWGVAKTTLDDVAREAGCSRATVYRLFPGGKDNLLDAAVRLETRRFLGGLAAALSAADDLEQLLVNGISYGSRHLREHAALQFVLAYEPEIVLPRIAFERLDVVFDAVGAAAAPFLAPHVGAEHAGRVAEWVTRIVISYTLTPSDQFDLADDEAVRRLVRGFVLPGLPTTLSTTVLSTTLTKGE
jgi:AcrR family transcriptional regulator